MGKGRDANGRWEKGVSGNPKGRPRRKQFDLELLRKLVTPEIEESIYRVAISQAEAGDRHARMFLWAYLYGKPIERRIVESTQDIEIVWQEADEGFTPPTP